MFVDMEIPRSKTMMVFNDEPNRLERPTSSGKSSFKRSKTKRTIIHSKLKNYSLDMGKSITLTNDIPSKNSIDDHFDLDIMEQVVITQNDFDISPVTLK